MFVMALLWAVAGWWIVLEGNLTLSLDEHSLYPVMLDGWSARFMATIFLLLSTSTGAAILQSLGAGAGWFWLLLLANLGLPFAYLLLT
jgi:hypothetical protein